MTRRFQKTPLWRPFSKTCLFGARTRRLRVEGRRKRRETISVFKKIRVDGPLISSFY